MGVFQYTTQKENCSIRFWSYRSVAVEEISMKVITTILSVLLALAAVGAIAIAVMAYLRKKGILPSKNDPYERDWFASYDESWDPDLDQDAVESDSDEDSVLG